MKKLKLKTIRNVNIRVGKPEKLEDNLKGVLYKNNVFDLEVEEIEGREGEKGNPNKMWYKDRNGDFLWSGGFKIVEETKNEIVKDNKLPREITHFGINKIWEQTKGNDTTVILLDTGIKDCEDLADIEIEQFKTSSFENLEASHPHGTIMASIIAGNGKNIYGIAPKCKIISIKISEVKSFKTKDFIEALKTIKKIIVKGKRYVVNCSNTLGSDLSESDKNEITKLINEISSFRNIVFVGAVGNHSEPIKLAPANLPNVISVAGMRFSNKENSFVRLSTSNYWKEISVAAPGDFTVDHLSDIFNKEELEPQGSSHACAYISGLLALFMSHPKTQKELKFDLINKFISSSVIKKTWRSKNYWQLDAKELIQSFNLLK